MTPAHFAAILVRLPLALCLAALILTSTQAQAGVPGGDLPPAGDDLRAIPAAPAKDLTVGVGCTYAAISHALAAAHTGDRLLLEGGRTFNEEGIILATRLTLVGGYAGCGSHSTARTTINGTGSNTVIAVSAPSPQIISLENLNITGGSDPLGGGIEVTASAGGLTLSHVSIYGNSANFGGGLYVSGNTVVTGTNVIVRENTAVVSGGGVRLFGGHAVFYNSEIYSNSAPLGAGVYGTYENSVIPRLDLLQSANIHHNLALAGSGYGGGIYMEQGIVTVKGYSDVHSNDAIVGGGIFAQNSTVNLDDGAELYDNEAGGDGGGAYLDNSNCEPTVHP